MAEKDLTIRLRTVGAEDVRNAILGVGRASLQSAKDAKAAADESRKTADAAKQTWQNATAAVAAASRGERAALQQTTREAKSAYQQAEVAARQAAAVQAQQSRNTLQVLQQTSRAIVQADKDVAASGIAAARARAQADKDAARVSAQAAKDAADAQKQAIQASQSPLINKLAPVTAVFQNDKYSQTKQALDSIQGVGLGLTASGAAGSAIIGKGLMNADEMKRTRKGLIFNLGSEKEADSRIGELKGIDRSSSFDFQGLTKNYNSLLGRGFNSQEAMDLLRKSGDLVARTQGTGENLTAVFQQFSQIKGKGKVGMQDINALSEGGGIPIVKILTEQLGQERMAGVMSGAEPLSADEFFGAFMKGVEQYKGGMEEANDSLAGDLSNLSSAFYQASDATNALLSPVRSCIQAVTAAVDWFDSLPKPIQDTVAYGAGITTLVIGLGGLTITFLASVGKAVLGLQTLRDAISKMGDSAATSAGKTAVGDAADDVADDASNASKGKGKGIAKKVGKAVANIGIAAAVEGAISDTTGFFSSFANDTDEDLQKKYGGKSQTFAGNVLQGGTIGMLRALGVPIGGIGDIAVAYRRLTGTSKATPVETTPPLPVGPTLATSAAISPLSTMGTGAGVLPNPTITSAPSTNLNTTGFSITNGETQIGIVSNFTAQIRALEDQKSAATGKANKETRAALTLQIRNLRRQEQDAKAAQRQANAEQRRNNKVSGYDADVNAVAAELAFNKRIDALQLELDNAKDAGNRGRVKALTTQIETEKAKQDLAKAREEAAKADLTDKARGDSLRQIAQLRYNDALQGAGTAGERAGLNVDGKTSDNAIRAMLNFSRGGGAIGGALGSFASQNRLAPGSGGVAGNRVLQVGQPMQGQNSLGQFEVQFPKVVFNPNPIGSMDGGFNP